MLDWLKRLFHREKTVKTESIIPEIAELARREDLRWKRFEKQVKEARKEAHASIREKNLERRQNILGSGMKSRNFRPRPAYEKKLWKLEKKAEEN